MAISDDPLPARVTARAAPPGFTGEWCEPDLPQLRFKLGVEDAAQLSSMLQDRLDRHPCQIKWKWDDFRQVVRPEQYGLWKDFQDARDSG